MKRELVTGLLTLSLLASIVALQTSCENFSNNLQKRNGA